MFLKGVTGDNGGGERGHNGVKALNNPVNGGDHRNSDYYQMKQTRQHKPDHQPHSVGRRQPNGGKSFSAFSF